MAQLVTRIDDDLAVSVDKLVELGIVASRSDAVRRGLRSIIAEQKRQATADAIVSGYEKIPQSETGVGWTDESTIEMIRDEPW